MKTQILLLVAAIFMVVGCKNDSDSNNTSNSGGTNTTTTDNTSNTSTSNENLPVYIAIVDNLRIREAPNKDGKELIKIDYDDKVFFLGEESDNTEKIKLRGETKTEKWKKVRVESNGKTIEGWTFGGGIIAETDLFTKTSTGLWERKIASISDKELEKLLDITLPEVGYYYKGTISYKKDGDQYIKEGKFSLKGSEKVEIYEDFKVDVGSELKGNYTNGQPNGVFERKHSGYEYGEVITVNYENGKCTWSSIFSAGEGQEYNHREENPKDCGFEYVALQMAEKYGF